LFSSIAKLTIPIVQLRSQVESQHVELWAIYAMEREDDVLEYLGEPPCYVADSAAPCIMKKDKKMHDNSLSFYVAEAKTQKSS
jgi:hypothetical protein